MVSKENSDNFIIECFSRDKKFQYNFNLSIPLYKFTEDISYLKNLIFKKCKEKDFIAYDLTTALTPDRFISGLDLEHNEQNLYYYKLFFPIYFNSRKGFSTSEYSVFVDYGLEGKSVIVTINDNCTFQTLIEKIKKASGGYIPDILTFNDKTIYFNRNKLNKSEYKLDMNQVDYNTSLEDYVCFYGIKKESKLTASKFIKVELLSEDNQDQKDILYINEKKNFDSLKEEFIRLKELGNNSLYLNYKEKHKKIGEVLGNQGYIQVGYSLTELQNGFVDLGSNREMKEGKFSDDAPDYRTISKGLNLWGKCKNKGCPAYNDYVICNYKKTLFNLQLDYAICPCCKKQFKAEYPSFFKCKYWFYGTYSKEDSDEIVKIRMKEKDALIANREDGSDAYNNHLNKTVNYDQLLISINLDLSSKGKKEPIGSCKYCNDSIYDKDDSKKLECLCLSHNDCLKQISLNTTLNSNISINNCSICFHQR